MTLLIQYFTDFMHNGMDYRVAYAGFKSYLSTQKQAKCDVLEYCFCEFVC